jgi:hypothetical protein
LQFIQRGLIQDDVLPIRDQSAVVVTPRAARAVEERVVVFRNLPVAASTTTKLNRVLRTQSGRVQAKRGC